ncbi:hypothetical protein ACVW1A_000664 [Bradyrhizobium sp. LB1.3]
MPRPQPALDHTSDHRLSVWFGNHVARWPDRANNAKKACGMNRFNAGSWPWTVIPPNPARKHPHGYDKDVYKDRNVLSACS